MVGIITFVHITACVLLIVMILLQQSKGDGMGSAFGGGGSQSVLGARGAATVITKITTILAITFMVTSLTLAYFSSQESSDSLLSTPIDQALEEPALNPTETGEDPLKTTQQEVSSSLPEEKVTKDTAENPAP